MLSNIRFYLHGVDNGCIFVLTNCNKPNAMNAQNRYNAQKDNTLSQMQQPVETANGLYVWEVWTYNNSGTITNIRFYAEDVEGGTTMRISQEDYINFVN